MWKLISKNNLPLYIIHIYVYYIYIEYMESASHSRLVFFLCLSIYLSLSRLYTLCTLSGSSFFSHPPSPSHLVSATGEQKSVSSNFAWPSRKFHRYYWYRLGQSCSYDSLSFGTNLCVSSMNGGGGGGLNNFLNGLEP